MSDRCSLTLSRAIASKAAEVEAAMRVYVRLTPSRAIFVGAAARMAELNGLWERFREAYEREDQEKR